MNVENKIRHDQYNNDQQEMNNLCFEFTFYQCLIQSPQFRHVVREAFRLHRYQGIGWDSEKERAHLVNFVAYYGIC